MLRLFWCVVITLIPLSILFTGASLDTMKTTVILTALPFLLVLLVKTYGFARWLKQDYAAIPAHPDRKQRAGAARGAAGRRTLCSIVVSTAPYGEMTIRKEEG